MRLIKSMGVGLRGLLLILMIIPATSAHADTLLFPAIEAQPPALDITLELPLQSIIREKARGGEEHDAVLRLADGAALPLKVYRRGKSRQDNCRFPPLWLDFKKKTTKGTVFAGQNKLKLVTHCNKGFTNKGYLAAEMLAYQLLNLFGERSFRTRAVQIHYVDSQRESRQQHWAFLIEHKSQLAKRLQASADKVDKVDRKQLDPQYSTLVAVHQYLIGNTDFSFVRGPEGDSCCHNVVPLFAGDTVFPVPYDFDASGLVNPPYAAPVPSLGIKRVTQRLYRGYCLHNNVLDEVLDTFRERRNDVNSHIASFTAIPDLKKDKVRRYVDRFYAVLADEKAVTRRIRGKCR